MLESLLSSFGVLLPLMRVEGDLRRILVAAALYVAAILLFEPGPAFAVFPFNFVLAPECLLPELHVLCHHAFPLVGVQFELAQQQGLFHFEAVRFGQEYLVIFFRVIGKGEALHIYAHGERDVVESRS